MDRLLARAERLQGPAPEAADTEDEVAHKVVENWFSVPPAAPDADIFQWWSEAVGP